MDFTREPVVETVITPKEGYQLVIRSSHGENREEYSVNAVEVIAFGNSYFFRSLEKPKEFLLPLGEYEVVEVKEVHPVLKKPQIEKSIKIGRKGRTVAKTAEKPQGEEKEEKKRTGKKTLKREKKFMEAPQMSPDEEISPPPSGGKRTLLPPPTSLISEQISRYKEYLTTQGVVLSDEEGETPSDEGKSRIEPLSQPSKEEFEAPFGGEGIISQTPSLESEEKDLFPKEEKVIELEEGTQGEPSFPFNGEEP